MPLIMIVNLFSLIYWPCNELYWLFHFQVWLMGSTGLHQITPFTSLVVACGRTTEYHISHLTEKQICVVVLAVPVLFWLKMRHKSYNIGFRQFFLGWMSQEKQTTVYLHLDNASQFPICSSWCKHHLISTDRQWSHAVFMVVCPVSVPALCCGSLGGRTEHLAVYKAPLKALAASVKPVLRVALLFTGHIYMVNFQLESELIDRYYGDQMTGFRAHKLHKEACLRKYCVCCLIWLMCSHI